MNYPKIILRNEKDDCWLSFSNPVEIVSISDLKKVNDGLQTVEDFVNRGYYAAGFISYEASTAFEPAFPTCKPSSLPLLWFGIYRQFEVIELPSVLDYTPPTLNWCPSISEDSYNNNISAIKDFIAKGDTYQVNYTFDLSSPFEEDALKFFSFVNSHHPAPYAAYLDIGTHTICSFSPELFFTLNNNILQSKPMKGTATRGRTTAEDSLIESELYNSEKNRAENVMIVDMIRNDLGRIAKTGSVEVTKLFEIEKYESVFQMTSTVEAQTRAGICDIFRALFPCASITGAPKIRTGQIIRELEKKQRGLYCGSIGFITPQKCAQFNVAIRSMTIDNGEGTAIYNIGSGIIWDSDTQNEYQECLSKANVITSSYPTFQLLETFLYNSESGYFLLDKHLNRCADSAAYFVFNFSKEKVFTYLQEIAKAFAPGLTRLRLTIDKNGSIDHSTSLIKDSVPNVTISLSKTMINSDNRFLYHKTTNRSVYNEILASNPGCDDVIMWNEREEITETTIGNVVFKLNGKLFTPPLSCGLLGGTLRSSLLEKGEIKEAALKVKEIYKCEEIYRINSVRMWQKCELTKTLTKKI